MPTAISAAGVSQAQLDNYAIHLRLEEINRKLRLNDFIPPERERYVHTFLTCAYILTNRRSSPSPPPTYDSHGRRTNTREVRYRKKLEDERIRLVDRAMKNDPNFRPPVEYHQQKRSQRPSEKVYIPVKEFPEINFFGLLVGPRGNSLKKMERDSGAKISIRGKGSVKEGKARPDQFADDAEEDLHCLVVADSEDKVAACVRMINKVIETVCTSIQHCHNSLMSFFRLLRPPKGRTITNATNFENLRLSMVLSVTTKTRSARTAVVLATGNMTARNSATLLLTSFVEFAEVLATWPAIATSTRIPQLMRRTLLVQFKGQASTPSMRT